MKKNIFVILIVFLFSFCLLSCVGAETIQEFYEQGDQAFSQGDYKKAIEWYEKVIELDPNSAPAYNALGLAHREINTDLSEVAWLFKTATEIDPSNPQAYDNLGKVYYALGEFDRAEESCLKALALSPKMLSTKLSLGWIYLLGKSKPKLAMRYFNEILEENKLPYAYFGLGMAYFMDNDRVSVLQIITTLRSMQKEDLAAQLEGMIRGSALAENKTDETTSDDNANPPIQNFTSRSPPNSNQYPQNRTTPSSSLIPSSGSGYAQQQPPPLSEGNIPGGSLMRVRLRGKMLGSPGGKKEESAQGYTAPVDTGLSNNVATRQRSAIERIRSLRTNAIAQGRATGSVNRQITNSQNQSTPAPATNINY